jgi:hypothetical protein
MGKVIQRFVEEMIYGIQARGSVRLSEVARALDEKILLKKVIERLSRNLGRDSLSECIGEAVLREGSLKVWGNRTQRGRWQRESLLFELWFSPRAFAGTP